MRPPAFQFYAAAFLSDKRVRLMSEAEIGLYTLMRAQMWLSDDGIPADPAQLARILGRERAEVQSLLSPAVLSFFWKDEHGNLFNAELEEYRAKLQERSAKNAKNGRKGGRATARKASNTSAVVAMPVSQRDKL